MIRGVQSPQIKELFRTKEDDHEGYKQNNKKI